MLLCFVSLPIFCNLKVELNFSSEALRAIAKQAMEKKTGARGLRAILVRICFTLIKVY